VAGAVVGGVATAATTPTTTSTTVVVPSTGGTAAPPCSVAPVAVNGVSYYNCGSSWYAAGYGSSGVVYVPVAPPQG
jgi:hypothetical protein